MLRNYETTTPELQITFLPKEKIKHQRRISL